MEAFLSGLALAILSALTFLAYKHPTGYRRISSKISLSVVVLTIALVVWSAGASRAFLAVLEFIPTEKMDAASAAYEAVDFVQGWMFVALILLNAYLLLLEFLPYILAGDDHPEGGEE